jgi:hypothetical protein
MVCQQSIASRSGLFHYFGKTIDSLGNPCFLWWCMVHLSTAYGKQIKVISIHDIHHSRSLVHGIILSLRIKVTLSYEK